MRQFLNFILSLILVLAITGGSVLGVFYFSLLNPDFYVQNIQQSQIFSELKKQAVENLYSEAQRRQIAPLFSRQFIADVLDDSFNEQQVYDRLVLVFEQGIKWFKSTDSIDDLILVIDFKQLKQSLIDSYEKKLNQRLQNLPECTPEQVADFQNGQLTQLCDLPELNIAEQIKSELNTQVLESNLNSFLQNEVDLGQIVRQDENAVKAMLMIQKFVNLIKTLILILAVIIATAGAGIFIVKGRDSRKFLSTLGIIFLISGILIFILIGLPYLRAKSLVNQIDVTTMSSDFSSFGALLAVRMMFALLLRNIIISVVFVILGIAFMVLGRRTLVEKL